MDLADAGLETAPEPVVARLLNGERLSVLGWSRAVLLQMSHPLIAAGVAAHSTFRGGVRQTAARLHGTIGAMVALTFGDDQERNETLARIRAIHVRVTGTLPRAAGPFAAGTPYSASDPELLLWVHATLLESIVMTTELLIGPVTTDARDAFCSESAPTLVALGGDPARAPRTWEALAGYIARMHRSGTLHITQEARDIADAVLRPRLHGVTLPGGALHRSITIGLLPSPIREAYGYSWDARRARRLKRIAGFLRVSRRLAPEFVARWPDGR